MKCNADLVVQAYGGGTRYHCPNCDTSKREYTKVVYWTNGPVPEGNKCANNVKKTRNIFHGFGG